MGKKKGPEQATAQAVKDIGAGKPVHAMTPSAEQANFEDITNQELDITDLRVMIESLYKKLDARFPECSGCGDYVETKKAGVFMNYNKRGSKTAHAMHQAIGTLRKGLDVMKGGAVSYFKAKPVLLEAAKAAGVDIKQHASNAPDAGHAATGAAAAPAKKRGRKPKAETAAAAPAKEPKKRGRKPKAEGEKPPAKKKSETKPSSGGRLGKKDLEALDKLKATEEQREKARSKPAGEERDKYIERLKNVKKAQKARKKQLKEEAKAAGGTQAPRGGRGSAAV